MLSSLSIYATDGIVTAADIDVENFKPPTGQRAVSYTQELWTNALRWRSFYQEFHGNATFIERLKQLMQ